MKNKTIVITGGAKGIGASISKIFLKDNYNVVIIDNDIASLNKINNKKIYRYYADISNEKQINGIIEDIYKRFNTIDILVNNAAKQIISSFDNISYSDWKKVIDTNLNGTFLVIKKSINYMKKNSTILNIISVHHDKPRKNKYSYDVSKSAIAMLTKELALEFSERNITINALSFGAVNTSMNEEWINNSKEVEHVLSKVPLKKIFMPDEIANFAHTIINEFSPYTTGTIFTIDAGRSLI